MGKCEVRQEDEVRRSIAHVILQKSTDLLKRIIVPVEGQGGVTTSYVCPHCHRYPLEDHIWWVSGHGKKPVQQVVLPHLVASMIEGNRTEYLSHKIARTADK